MCIRPPPPLSSPSVPPQVFGGDSDEDDLPESQSGAAGAAKGGDRARQAPRDQLEDEDDVEDEFDFIVDDHGQPIRRRKEDGTYTEP